MAKLTIRVEDRLATISPMLYGHFAEHLGSCIYGGLWLGKNSPLADANTARKIEQQCRDLLERRLSRVGVAGQVRSRLLHNPGELPSMPTIADELHIDQRTLRRRLAAEGTSYRALLDEVRRQLALELLQQDLSVEEISRHLGYAETANFTHAFKRWEGTAPSYFRRPR